MRVIAALHVIILIAGSSTTWSAEMYAQFHLGATKFPSADIGSTNATMTQDRTDTFLSITGGIQASKNIGLELSYVDFGKYTNEIQANFAPFNSGPPSSYEVEADAFSIGVRPSFTLSDSINLDFIVGIHSWNLDGTNRAVSYNNGVFEGFTVERNSNSGTDPFVGFGVSYKFNQALKLKSDIAQYSLDDDDLRTWTIGGEYSFK